MNETKKIKLEIIGLRMSDNKSGSYILILAEEKGTRRLGIAIGAFEAQAIAIELENMTPVRPLTHDLFKSFAGAFDVEIEEVIIFNLLEGVFYAKLICSNGEKRCELDARTSDAVALAVRFGSAIYTYEFILAAAGTTIDIDTPPEEETLPEEKPETKSQGAPLSEKEIANTSTEELNEYLKRALDEEAYERASRIRDELAKRKRN